jgi:tetratricopeptide (TPR) repeat protein
MTTQTPTDLLTAGWGALRAFFTEGTRALERATPLFLAAEREVRAGGDVTRLSLWLLGVATACRYSRRPEAMDRGLERARELVNLVARTQSEAAAVPFRTLVEALALDLSRVVPAEAARHLEEALAYSDRTVRLARASARDGWIAQALASRGDLLLRRATTRREARQALAVHEEARRRWPVRDDSGRAQAGLGYGEALLAVGEARRAEAVARECLAAFRAQRDRYHEAAACLLLARALYAQGDGEALEAHAAAVAAYRALGCRWELACAEEALR